jgi:hypothetical protein
MGDAWALDHRQRDPSSWNIVASMSIKVTIHMELFWSQHGYVVDSMRKYSYNLCHP